MTWRALGSWRPSRIGLRLLAFNLLVVFVPVTGVFYLDAYETKLLQAQEREMVQQARVLAAVLGGEEDLDPDALTATFARLERRSEARLRVFDGTGVLVADSDRVPRGTIETPSNLYPVEPSGPISTRKRILYRLGAWLANAREAGTSRLRAWLTRPPPPGATDLSAGGLDVALREALAGRYGAATRATPGQRSLTLFSGLPIRQQGRVTGAVVVSQSTFRILRALYAVRLRLFEIVVASILVAAALTTLSATTIVRPLTRLRRRADALAQRRGTQPSDFPATNRRDEIGALARALQHLTRRLDEQIARLEAFASDVAHEFRNPLASIRAAADTISTSESAEERQRFLDMMRRDIQRLDRLVSGTRDLARLDGQIEHDAQDVVDLAQIARGLIDDMSRTRGAMVSLRDNGQACLVRGSRERLSQAIENLLSNACELTPAGTSIDVGFETIGRNCRLTVADRGPGIPEAHLERVFERFFSYRPGGDRREHLGLGLAIAKQVIAGYGGTIRARNRAGGGAVFEVDLPAADRLHG
jgi:two-component system, OmpR family, sensor histidine kinase ChvG